jgi:hypothetical protein
MNLAYDMSEQPTEKELEHQAHKSEGDMFSWCSQCRDEEFCLKCEGIGTKDGVECVECESSGRRI